MVYRMRTFVDVFRTLHGQGFVGAAVGDYRIRSDTSSLVLQQVLLQRVSRHHRCIDTDCRQARQDETQGDVCARALPCREEDNGLGHANDCGETRRSERKSDYPVDDSAVADQLVSRDALHQDDGDDKLSDSIAADRRRKPLPNLLGISVAVPCWLARRDSTYRDIALAACKHECVQDAHCC